MNFDSFGLHRKVLAGLPPEFVSPTPIQQRAIPSLLQGRDLLGLAHTGTGKTAAFVLPILDRLVRERESAAAGAKNFNHNRGHILRALILAPTRELAEQIADAVMTLGSKTEIRCTTIYGGVSMNPQIQKLRQGTDVVVACPGRLLDHMQQRTVDLRNVDMLVLDEADQMFDMGFLPGVRKIIQALPGKKQTLLFSATMPPDVRRLADELLTDPESVQVGGHKPVSTVSHSIYVVDQARKSELLLLLLKDVGPGSVLVFTRTKYGASRLGLALARKGFDATSLQGNMSQRQRQDALDGFRDGTFQVLVATDIAARGIDVQSVSHVINYDMPSTVEAYTHRIGRTGRAERSGDALTLVTRADFSMLREIERRLGAPIDRRPLPEEFVNAPADRSQADRSESEERHRGSPRTANARHGRERRAEYRKSDPRKDRQPRDGQQRDSQASETQRRESKPEDSQQRENQRGNQRRDGNRKYYRKDDNRRFDNRREDHRKRDARGEGPREERSSVGPRRDEISSSERRHAEPRQSESRESEGRQFGQRQGAGNSTNQSRSNAGGGGRGRNQRRGGFGKGPSAGRSGRPRRRKDSQHHRSGSNSSSRSGYSNGARA